MSKRLENSERLQINYIPVIPNDYVEIKHDLSVFNRVAKGYDKWCTPEPPNIYRRGLITVIKLGYTNRERTMAYLRAKRETNEMERIMFDSGGFQMFLDPTYTIERLVRENLWLYQKHDWADCYVMPDNPPFPEDPRVIMEMKVDKTIKATRGIFEDFPSKIREKSMPVFHVRNTMDIDYQYEEYKHIIEESQLVCYAVPGSRKKLDLHNMKMIAYLRSVLDDDVKIHSLGVASAPAVYCMEQLGVYSYDAVSPIISAGLGMIQFYDKSYDLSEEKPNRSITEEELNKIKETTEHKCPFCDDYENSLKQYRYRRLHNLIIFDEYDWFFRDMSFDEFRVKYPTWANTLEIALGEDKQATLDISFEENDSHALKISSDYLKSRENKEKKKKAPKPSSPTGARRSSGRRDDLWAQCDKIVDMYVNERLGLKAISDQFGCSDTLIESIVKKTTGVKYLRELR